jgi:hypothetical protein
MNRELLKKARELRELEETLEGAKRAVREITMDRDNAEQELILEIAAQGLFHWLQVRPDARKYIKEQVEDPA